MRVSRSLTIKQMAMVASVSMAFVLVFCTILLFHFVQQSRFTTATQLESIARSVREPLSAAILKADIPEAGSHFKPYPACWHRQPGGCGIAEPVPGAADAIYPRAAGAGNRHPAV